MNDRANRLSWGAPILFALLLVSVGGQALDQYNVTWDESVGEFFFGQRAWSFYTTGDRVYLDYSIDPYPDGFVPDLSSSPQRHPPLLYYPFGATLAAGTSELLFRELRWLDPWDGFHAVNLWLSVVLVFACHGFLLCSFGPVVAVLAPFLLFLCPRLVFALMANTKDFPTMVFFATTLVVFYHYYQRASFLGVVGSGVLFGFTLASKTNGVFIVPIVGLLFLLAPFPAGWRSRKHALAAIAGAGILGLGTLIAAWPHVWEAPLSLLLEHGRSVVARLGWVPERSVSPFLPTVAFTTPLPFLALFAVGIWPLAQRIRRREGGALLIALWIAVVAGRYALPGAVNFDGVRHFLELFPPLAVVSALGLAWLLERAAQLSWKRVRSALQVALVALPLVSMAWSVRQSHPFEVAYWNAAIGGLPGARAAGMPQAGDYWGSSYRLGLEWLAENAAPGAALAVPLIEHAVQVVAPQRLRLDMELLPLNDDVGPATLARLRREARRREVYVMFVLRHDWMNFLMHALMSQAAPVQRWDLEGEPILLIYRLGEG